MLETLAYVLGGYIAIMHLAGPLIVLRKNRFPCSCDLSPLAWPDTLEAGGQRFRECHGEMVSLGFVPVAASNFGLPHSSTPFIIYRSDEDPVVATLMFNRSGASEHVVVDFTQRYTGGHHLSLTNVKIPDIYPRWEMKQLYRLPGCADIPELFLRFQRLRRRKALGEHASVPPGKELEIVKAFINAEWLHLCNIGFLQRECAAGTRSLTLRGAYSATWKLLAPWRWLLGVRDQANAKRLSDN